MLGPELEMVSEQEWKMGLEQVKELGQMLVLELGKVEFIITESQIEASCFQWA